MKDVKEEHEGKAEMFRRREELLKSMDEKELRAFIKGYMMAERMTFRRMKSVSSCCSDDCGGSCKESSQCSCGSCGSCACSCDKDNCSCGRE